MPAGMFDTVHQFHDALTALPTVNKQWYEQACARQNELTKPPGSLGDLEDIAVFLSGWGRTPRPRAEKVKLAIFAGNHGVVAQGVSPYPSDVTEQMVANFSNGGAAVNALTDAFGIKLDVFPLSLKQPTADISNAPALGEVEALAALNAGARVVADDVDVLCLGEMGIGNTTIAAALAAQSFGGGGAEWVGPGTGLDAAGVQAKADVVNRALGRHKADNYDTVVGVMRSLGGRETLAIAGAVVAARLKRVPVILDGYVVCAAICPVFASQPDVIAHCLAGHVSAEPAHRKMLQKLGLKPILDLGMRLGEGSGAALAAQVVRAAVASHNNMATFAEAAVSNRQDED